MRHAPVDQPSAGPPGGAHSATGSESAAESAPVPGGQPGQAASWWPLAAICLAIFMLLIDITVVNVALPDIERQLGATFNGLQWVIDAYALTLASFLLTAGSLGDRIGRRSIFAGGIVLFASASLACGLAQSPLQLEIFRAIQGVGGAAMFATSLALLASSYRGKQRGTAFGIWGATTGASTAVGPLIGGALVTGLSWRWIFFVNLPIAAVAVWLTLRRVGESRDPQPRPIDWVGFVVFSAALALLVFALIRGNDSGWAATQTIAEFAGAALLLAGFAVYELRRPDRAMLDVQLFRRRTFTGAQIVAFAVSASLFSLFLYLTLYLQNVLGYSAFGAGLRLIPITVMSLCVAPAAGRLTNRIAYRVLLGVGLAAVTAGLLLMYGLSADSTWWALLAGFVVSGVGIGLVNPPLGSLAVGVVGPERSGMASGINSTMRQVGIATGTAAFGAIFASRVGSVLHADLPAGAIPAGQFGQVRSAVTSGAIGRVASQVPGQYRQQFVHAARDAFTTGLNELFLVAAGVAAVGAVLAAGLITNRQLSRHR